MPGTACHICRCRTCFSTYHVDTTGPPHAGRAGSRALASRFINTPITFAEKNKQPLVEQTPTLFFAITDKHTHTHARMTTTTTIPTPQRERTALSDSITPPSLASSVHIVGANPRTHNTYKHTQTREYTTSKYAHRPRSSRKQRHQRRCCKTHAYTE